MDIFDIQCPGCGVSLTPENAGGYRKYCWNCVEALPPLPDNGGYELTGTYPDFQWRPVDNGGTRRINPQIETSEL